MVPTDTDSEQMNDQFMNESIVNEESVSHLDSSTGTPKKRWGRGFREWGEDDVQDSSAD